jgi:NAD(P)-dependent dehydrogenase (short-subunit alcohol dehydrogenase family)
VREWAPHNIQVERYRTGYFKTELNASLSPTGFRRMGGADGRRRAVGSPEELIGVAFSASRASTS